MVDVAELEQQPATRPAVLEVRLDLRGLAGAQAAAHVRAELARDRPAALVERVLQVLLEVGLPQSLARPVGERGHAVRGQPEDGRDLRRRQALDLGVPQHGLPPLGQRVERARDDAALEAGERGVLRGAGQRGAGLEHRDVVGRLDAAVLSRRSARHAAHDGEQVRAERRVGPVAALEGAEDGGERVGDDVVGVRRRVRVLPGDHPRRAGVPFVERAEAAASPERAAAISSASPVTPPSSCALLTRPLPSASSSDGTACHMRRFHISRVKFTG